MVILLYLALLPAAGLMLYVYKKDKVDSEPVGLVLRVFLLGAASGIAAAILESIIIPVFEAIIPPGALLIIVTYFVGVAAIEEGCKYACLLTVRKNPAFDYVFDGVVYGVAAALGFAALENVFYVIDGGVSVAIVRAIFSVPGHMADGVVMGVFFGLARQRELHGNSSGARTYYLLAYLFPVIEHGLYDAALSFETDLSVIIAFLIDIAFIAAAFVLIHTVSKNDSHVHPNGPAGMVANRQPTQQPGILQPGAQQPGFQPGQQPGVQQVGFQPAQQPGVQQAGMQQGVQQFDGQQYRQPAQQPGVQQYRQPAQPDGPQYRQPAQPGAQQYRQPAQQPGAYQPGTQQPGGQQNQQLAQQPGIQQYRQPAQQAGDQPMQQAWQQPGTQQQFPQTSPQPMQQPDAQRFR